MLPDVQLLASFAAERIALAGCQSARRRGRFALAIPGGRTVVPLLQALARPPARDAMPWKCTHVFWTDERCVAFDSPESNYGVARRELLAYVPLPAGQIHPVPAELPPEEAASAYAGELASVTGWQGLDLVVLGVGEDGHTASLFAGSSGASPQRGALACQAPNGQWRVTLTLGELAAAAEVRFLVAGASKAEVVAQALSGEPAIMAARVRPASGDLEWWLDRAAAAAVLDAPLAGLIGASGSVASAHRPALRTTGASVDDPEPGVGPEAMKRKAAEAAVRLVGDGMVLGLGTGSTVRYVVARIADRLASGDLADVVGIPTSQKTAELAQQLGIPLTSLEEQPTVELAIDGADEVAPGLDLIKGGGGALVREKIVACAARRLAIVADMGKCVGRLGSRMALPIAVLPFGWSQHLPLLRQLGAQPALRTMDDGSPFITDDGLRIIDARFEHGLDKPENIERTLMQQPGIVATGLFLGMADVAFIGRRDGVVAVHRG